ncbi:MAG: hypothetical protein EOO71_25530 [Myxococcaceae bacterium]|nr:MAG: hypothetical protein EOO71_25530 [Myxococcaceae bacterium]
MMRAQAWMGLAVLGILTAGVPAKAQQNPDGTTSTGQSSTEDLRPSDAELAQAQASAKGPQTVTGKFVSAVKKQTLVATSEREFVVDQDGRQMQFVFDSKTQAALDQQVKGLKKDDMVQVTYLPDSKDGKRVVSAIKKLPPAAAPAATKPVPNDAKAK